MGIDDGWSKGGENRDRLAWDEMDNALVVRNSLTWSEAVDVETFASAIDRRDVRIAELEGAIRMLHEACVDADSPMGGLTWSRDSEIYADALFELAGLDR